MPDKPHLEQLAEAVGAMPMGFPTQYLFTAEQLIDFARAINGQGAELSTLADRLQKKGVKVAIYC